MSAVTAIALVVRLGDDAHLRDVGLLHRIHNRGKGAEWDILISAQVDGLVLRITNPCPQDAGNIVDVDGLITQVHALALINRDHHALLADFLHRLCFGYGDFDARLQYRRSHHEDDQQNQHNVNEWRDVDIAQRRLRAPFFGSERHQSAPAPVCAEPPRSTALRNSRPKSSMRAPNSRIWCWNWL